MIITEHQKRPCPMCADDATAYNHCAFCGRTFDNFDQLDKHLDECPEFKKVFP